MQMDDKIGGWKIIERKTFESRLTSKAGLSKAWLEPAG
jgi:hypothetical protein